MQATRTCSIDGCERCAEKRGWCNAHYKRWRRHGDPMAGRRAPTGGTCSVTGCEEPHRTGSYCNMHALRVRKHGDPLRVDPSPIPPRLCGVAHPNWLGAEAGYDAAHRRAVARWGRAKGHVCLHCGGRAAHWAYDKSDPRDLIDKRGCRYSLKPDHYIPLCVSCHWRFDGAGQRLHAGAGA